MLEAISLEIELRIQELTTLLILFQQAISWGPASAAGGRSVPSTKPSLFLAFKAISMDLFHEMKLSPVRTWETRVSPGWSDGWRKKGLESSAIAAMDDQKKLARTRKEKGTQRRRVQRERSTVTSDTILRNRVLEKDLLLIHQWVQYIYTRGSDLTNVVRD